MTRWTALLDPDCPDVELFIDGLFEDPPIGAVIDDVIEDFTTNHHAHCVRCNAYKPQIP